MWGKIAFTGLTHTEPRNPVSRRRLLLKTTISRRNRVSRRRLLLKTRISRRNRVYERKSYFIKNGNGGDNAPTKKQKPLKNSNFETSLRYSKIFEKWYYKPLSYWWKD